MANGSISNGGSAMLAFVTREVLQKMTTKAAKPCAKTKKVVREEKEIVNPMIIFFPSGSSTVLPRKTAKEKGFLAQPPIMNFDTVTDNTTAAGQYKYGITPETKLAAFQQMENEVIARCTQKSGAPLPEGVRYDNQSIFQAKSEVTNV